ncbi:O-methyltransferase involved in polyketide biosynthesis [Nocardia sp. GAS34]
MAQEVDPAARIVYVDKDPLVLAHARALMKSTPEGRTTFIHADLRDPETILRDSRYTETIDPDRPVGIMLISVLMYFRDSDGIHDIIARVLDAVAPGSSLAISHFTADFDPRGAEPAARAAERSGITLITRDRAETERLFTGTNLVAPGISTLEAWHLELAEVPLFDVEPHSGPAWAWAGMWRKPRATDTPEIAADPL